MRLIDADALVNQIRQEPTDGMYTEEILEIIGNEPTIEAAPVVHGRWVTRKSWYFFVCSECSYESVSHSGYCPNCGARMDGDADG